jgi:hypothetical protein
MVEEKGRVDEAISLAAVICGLPAIVTSGDGANLGEWQ